MDRKGGTLTDPQIAREPGEHAIAERVDERGRPVTEDRLRELLAEHDEAILEEATANNFDIQGTLTYSTAACLHVTATFQADEVPLGPNSCLFAGTALHTPS